MLLRLVNLNRDCNDRGPSIECPAMKTLILGFLSASTAFAQQDEFIGGHVKQWLPQFSGRAKASGDQFEGTRTNLRTDFGLETPRNGIQELGLWLSLPVLPFRIYGTTYGGEFSESELLQQTITYEDTTYNAGTTIDVDMELRTYTLMLEFGFGTPRLPLSLEFGFQAGVHYFRHKIEVSGGGVTVGEAIDGPIPMLGARVSVWLIESLEAFAQLQGVSTFGRVDEVEAHYIDLTLEARWYPFSFAGIGLGYRLIELFGESKDPASNDSVLLRLDGLMVSIIIRV
jgi:hypothetical protein